jgi:hypothetical protein
MAAASACFFSLQRLPIIAHSCSKFFLWYIALLARVFDGLAAQEQ